jgi:hypothetical protein
MPSQHLLHNITGSLLSVSFASCHSKPTSVCAHFHVLQVPLCLCFGNWRIQVPFGDDMKFQNAHKQYANMDKLIKAVNGRPELGINLKFVSVLRV